MTHILNIPILETIPDTSQFAAAAICHQGFKISSTSGARWMPGSIEVDLEKGLFGLIGEPDPSDKAGRFVTFLRMIGICRPQRRFHVANVRIESTNNWIFHVYGDAHMDAMEKLAEALRAPFKTEIQVVRASIMTRQEELYSDVDCG